MGIKFILTFLPTSRHSKCISVLFFDFSRKMIKLAFCILWIKPIHYLPVIFLLKMLNIKPHSLSTYHFLLKILNMFKWTFVWMATHTWEVYFWPLCLMRAMIKSLLIVELFHLCWSLWTSIDYTSWEVGCISKEKFDRTNCLFHHYWSWGRQGNMT